MEAIRCFSHLHLLPYYTSIPSASHRLCKTTSSIWAPDPVSPSSSEILLYHFFCLQYLTPLPLWDSPQPINILKALSSLKETLSFYPELPLVFLKWLLLSYHLSLWPRGLKSGLHLLLPFLHFQFTFKPLISPICLHWNLFCELLITFSMQWALLSPFLLNLTATLIVLITSICLKLSTHLTSKHTFSLFLFFLFSFLTDVSFMDSSFSTYLLNVYVLLRFCLWPISFVLLSTLYYLHMDDFQIYIVSSDLPPDPTVY